MDSQRAQAETPALPFSVKVTPLEKLDPLPDYLGGRYTGDFPPCGVKIGDEFWMIDRPAGTRTHRFKGTNIENAVMQPDGDAPPFPVERPYMLGGAMWYDEDGKRLYTAMHCETPGYPTVEVPNASHPTINRQIHLASSGDKGLSWRYEGPIVTRDVPERMRRGAEFSGLYWDGGDGDFMLYVDERGGYIYLFTSHYTWFKPGVRRPGLLRYRVARCAIRDKMAPGKWKRFYNGAWEEPGLGGKGSYVNGFRVIYNTALGKYLAFTYGSGLTVCRDLSKQDWGPIVPLGEDLWGGPRNETIGFHVVDEGKTNLFVAGKTMFLYTCFNQKFGGAYRIEVAPGMNTSPATGCLAPAFNPMGSQSHPWRIVSTESAQWYPLEPVFDSSDPIESRRTRRVGCLSAETVYAGDWRQENGELYYENAARTSDVKGASAGLVFRSDAIYWRVFKGPDAGKADVYLDGKLEKTVDCWAAAGTPFQFGFIKTGLDPKQEHTIKVVVRGEKNAAATGTAIRHLLFEYGAESYRASDCFSGVVGKHGWFNQEREPARETPYRNETRVTGPWYMNMRFEHPNWVRTDIWDQRGHGPEVGHFHMRPGPVCAAVRAWVAPHDGKVRIEGPIEIADTGGEAMVEILHRHAGAVSPLRARRKLEHGKAESPDFTVELAAGDVLYFVVEKSREQPTPADRVVWDPVVTYVD
ncbi:MAG: hypothetical protein FJ225_02480 [Lentisphaerae bacterium]|nr:hypothetical protein [Lentisphaerota bacterium]